MANIKMEEDENVQPHLNETIVLPGDVIGKLNSGKKMKLGDGIGQKNDDLIALKCGILRIKGHKYWIDGRQKRYVPKVEDFVVGVVAESHFDHARVDIGSSSLATLAFTTFEGFTNKNKPDLDSGSVVYARVVLANKDMEPQLSCVGASGKADGLGILAGGWTEKGLTSSLTRSLLLPDCPVLMELSKITPFEIAVGFNGRVWISAPSIQFTILIKMCILESEFIATRAELGQKVQETRQRIFSKQDT